MPFPEWTDLSAVVTSTGKMLHSSEGGGRVIMEDRMVKVPNFLRLLLLWKGQITVGLMTWRLYSCPLPPSLLSVFFQPASSSSPSFRLCAFLEALSENVHTELNSFIVSGAWLSVDLILSVLNVYLLISLSTSKFPKLRKCINFPLLL